MNFGWVTINVKDISTSLKFYEEIAGFKIKRKIEPKNGIEIAFLGFDKPGTELELICNNKIPIRHSDNVSLGFEINNLSEKIRFLESKGFQIDGPYQPGPNIKFIYIKDPDGVKIQFFENS